MTKISFLNYSKKPEDPPPPVRFLRVKQLKLRKQRRTISKVCSFGHVHSQVFALVNTHVHGKFLALSCHAMVIFEQLILFFKSSFSRYIFHKITGISDALKNNTHDQNEHTIQRSLNAIALTTCHSTGVSWPGLGSSA